jgi:hypothetical protein
MPSKNKKKIIKEESEEELNSFDEENEFESGSESGSTDDVSESESDNSESSESDSQIYSKYSDVYSDSDDNGDNDKDIDKSDKKSVFLENVIKYLETDNIIYKKKQKYNEEIKVLKEDKTCLEDLILKYLNEINDDCIEIKGEGKLTKTISEKKSAVKNENIHEAISEIVKKEKLVEKDEDIVKLINNIMETIDSKRVVTRKEYLKRTREKKKGKAKGKGKKKKK